MISFDARGSIRIGGFTIRDFHGKNRILTVPEIFIYSSNIGTARMADIVGIEGHKEFLTRMGLLTRMQTELPEVATPNQPPVWKKISSITISFGHGVSTTPLQTAVAAAALMNGGKLIEPTFLPRTVEQADQLAVQVIQPSTSKSMRDLMQMNVANGSGRRARGRGLSRRRQDRHGGEGGQWTLRFLGPVQRLPVRLPDRQSRICGACGD